MQPIMRGMTALHVPCWPRGDRECKQQKPYIDWANTAAVMSMLMHDDDSDGADAAGKHDACMHENADIVTKYVTTKADAAG